MGHSGDIAVVGGGIQGTLVALALAGGGRRVHLFERAPALLRGATRAAEGKLHCGYTHALDRSGGTSRLLLRHALAFEPSLRAIADGFALELRWSDRFVYALHRDSRLDVDQALAHYRRLERWRDELSVAAAEPGEACGDDTPRHRLLGPDERASHYGEAVLAAIEVPEHALSMPPFLASLEAAVVAHPGIELRVGSAVVGLRELEGKPRVLVDGGAAEGPFAAVVNCSWDSLLELDRAAGLEPLTSWSFRRKAGIHGRVAESAVPPTTFVYGPFGDLVPFPDGRFYCSWYPRCRLGFERALVPPPSWRCDAELVDVPGLVADTLGVMSSLAPRFRAAPGAHPAAGVIFAYGDQDIHVSTSRLHRRTDIGVRAKGRYLSVNTGKLTSAPAHALEVCRLLD